MGRKRMSRFFGRFSARERRATPRIANDLPAAIHRRDAADPLHGYARDLGIGGICIATHHPFPFESASRVVLQSGGSPLEVGAKGLWQSYEDGEKVVLTGFAFIEPSGQQREHIAKLVAASLRRIARRLARTRLPDLGVADLRAVAETVRLRNFRAGRVVYGARALQDHAGSIFVLEEGRVSLHLADARSRRVALAVVEKGDVFGSAALGASPPLPEIAIAESDTRLLEIHRSAFEHLRQSRPQLAIELAYASFRAASLRHCTALLAADAWPSPDEVAAH